MNYTARDRERERDGRRETDREREREKGREKKERDNETCVVSFCAFSQSLFSIDNEILLHLTSDNIFVGHGGALALLSRYGTLKGRYLYI